MENLKYDELNKDSKKINLPPLKSIFKYVEMENENDDDDSNVIDLTENEGHETINKNPENRDGNQRDVNPNRRITRSIIRNSSELRDSMSTSVDTSTNYGRTRSQTHAMLTNLIFEVSESKCPQEPITFSDAWDNEDQSERELWREAIRKEFKDLRNRNVWRTIPRQKNMRTIRLKWVFKIKKDTTH